MFRYFFYLLTVLVTLGEIVKFQLYPGINISFADVLLIILLIYWLYLGIRKQNKTFTKQEFFYPILLFIFVCLISLIINAKRFQINELLISSLYLIRWTMYAFVFYIVKSFNNNLKPHLLNIIFFNIILFTLFGIIQYVYYPNLRNIFYLGWDDHLYRLFSTYLDPNYAAAQINLFIFMLFSLISVNYYTSVNKKIFLYVLISFSLLSLLLTYSRSGYLMFFTGATAEMWLLNKKRVLIFIISIFFVGILLIPKDLGSSGVELWRTASIFARSQSVFQAAKIIVNNPVFGVGFNTYRYVQKEYGFLNDITWQTSHSGAGTDNSILFVLATTGLVGLLVYVKLWLSITLNLYNKFKSKQSYIINKAFTIAAISSILGLFINSQFINSLFFPPIMFWVWTLIGLSFTHEKTR